MFVTSVLGIILFTFVLLARKLTFCQLLQEISNDSEHKSSEWASHITYNFFPTEELNSCGGNLKVNFISDRNYSFYQVALWRIRRSGTSVTITCKERGKFEVLELKVTAKNSVMFKEVPPGAFCLGLQQFAINGRPVGIIAYPWQSKGPLFIDCTETQCCRRWNGTISVRSSPAVTSVRFEIFQSYADCFDAFNIILLITTTRFCTIRSGELTEVEQKLDVDSGDVVNFENLLPGNYCIHIQAVTPGRPPGSCRKLHRFFQLTEPELEDVLLTDTKSRSGQSDYTRFWWLYIILAVTIIAVTTSIFAVWHCARRRNSGSANDPDTSVNTSMESLKPCERSDKNLSKVKVLLILFPDSDDPNQETLVGYFIDFLHQCWRVEVITVKEMPMYINDIGCILKHFRSISNEHREECIWKIIVIELGVSRMQEKRRNQPFDNIHEKVASHALSLMETNDRSLNAYRNLAVVRFPFMDESEYLPTLVPNMRYVIPRDLDYLHEFLYASALEEHWKNSQQYKQLKNLVERLTPVTV